LAVGGGKAVADLNARFSKPVISCEIVAAKMWRDGDEVNFRAKLKEPDEVVPNNGLVVLC